MNQKDVMKEWIKELPAEKLSPDFTVKVMQRVMSEWTLNPIKYQPIISKKGWWSIGMITLIATSLLFMIHASLPAEADSAAKTVYGFDLAQLFTPIGHIFEKLTNISPAFAIGAVAIIALWFFDQLIVKTVKR